MKVKKLKSEEKTSKIKSGKSRKKVIIISVILLVAIIAGIFFAVGRSKKTSGEMPAVEAMVERRTVSNSISGSGTVAPISRYEIVSLVSGDILACNYEEGDTVKEGDVLYNIDSTDMVNSIEKQKNSLSKTNRSYAEALEDLQATSVKAPASGILTDFNVKAGENVSSGKIATISNTSDMIATVPFNASQIQDIKIGDNATLTSALYMSSVDGTVTYVSNAATSNVNGTSLYDVEISFSNPGALSSGASIGATVHTSGGDLKSPASGSIKNSDDVYVVPEVSGKVTTVYARNNQYVNKGDVLFKIDDESYQKALTDASLSLNDSKLSLETLESNLEKYNITSPIDGVVLTKNYKTGDTVGSGSNNSSTVLMVVADTSKMIFELEVDELDILSVKLGLEAEITCDTLPNEIFAGKVTKIAREGTASYGVTTYTVEITIDEPGQLLSGMNVDAEIIVESSENTLVLPVEAVSNINNGYGIVYVKSDSESAKNAEENPIQPESPGFARQNTENTEITESSEAPEKMERPEDMERPEGIPESETTPDADVKEQPKETEEASAKVPETENQGERRAFKLESPFDGYTAIRVKLGIANSDYIEVLEGLSEGDEVKYYSSIAANTGTVTTQQGMPGGMMGGGMMGGGMSGGMPGGNMRAGGGMQGGMRR